MNPQVVRVRTREVRIDVDEHGRLTCGDVAQPGRTIEQGPTFAFRILVDIATKALSAAIYDPTTAVTAIDQIHRLLRLVGLRGLSSDEIRDAAAASS